MDSINRLFIWNDQLRADDSLLHSRLDSCTIAFRLFHHSDSLQITELQLNQQSLQDRDSVIIHQQKLITDQQRVIIKLRIHKGLLSALSGVLAIAGIWLLLR